MSKNIEKLIERYVALRDKKKDIQERHKAELAPFNDTLATLEQKLYELSVEHGVESFKTSAGTAYQTKRVTYRIDDREEFMNYVLDNQRYDLLQASVNKTAAEELGGDIPGANRIVYNTVNVNRPR